MFLTYVFTLQQDEQHEQGSRTNPFHTAVGGKDWQQLPGTGMPGRERAFMMAMGGFPGVGLVVVGGSSQRECNGVYSTDGGTSWAPLIPELDTFANTFAICGYGNGQTTHINAAINSNARGAEAL